MLNRVEIVEVILVSLAQTVTKHGKEPIPHASFNTGLFPCSVEFVKDSLEMQWVARMSGFEMVF